MPRKTVAELKRELKTTKAELRKLEIRHHKMINRLVAMISFAEQLKGQLRGAFLEVKDG